MRSFVRRPSLRQDRKAFNIGSLHDFHVDLAGDALRAAPRSGSYRKLGDGRASPGDQGSFVGRSVVCRHLLGGTPNADANQRVKELSRA